MKRIKILILFVFIMLLGSYKYDEVSIDINNKKNGNEITNIAGGSVYCDAYQPYNVYLSSTNMAMLTGTHTTIQSYVKLRQYCYDSDTGQVVSTNEKTQPSSIINVTGNIQVQSSGNNTFDIYVTGMGNASVKFGYSNSMSKTLDISVSPSMTSADVTIDKSEIYEGETAHFSLTTNSHMGVSNVVWSSSDESIATISGNKTGATLTAKKAGTVQINYLVTDYGGCSVGGLALITVKPAFSTLSLSPSNVILKEGDTTTVTINHDAYYGIKNVSFSNVNGRVELTASGNIITVRGKHSGTQNVTVTVTDNHNNVKDVQLNITVNTSFTSFTASPSYLNMYTNTSQSVSFYHNSYNGLRKVTCSSADESVAYVVNCNISGVTIVGLTSGQINILATAENFDGVSKTERITVKVSKPVVESVNFKQGGYSVGVGLTAQTGYDVYPLNSQVDQIDYFSANTSVATIDSNGVITGVSPGITSIIIDVRSGSYTRTSMASVSVSSSNISLSIKNSSKTMKVGDTSSLSYSISGNGNASFNPTWSSSDTSVISINQNGRIEALKEGTSTISLYDTHLGVFASVTVQVIVPINKVVSTNAKDNYSLGETIKLEYDIEPSNATDRGITWVSSNPAVANVLDDGTVMVIGPGTADISVVTEDGDTFVVTTVNVGDATHEAVDPGDTTEEEETPETVDNPTTGLTISIICGIILMIGLVVFKISGRYFNRIRKI